MIRTIIASSTLLIICSFVQSTWFGSIAVFGVIPDLSLIVLVWVSYKNGFIEGSISGFLSGFAEDCLSASPLGFHAFIKVFVSTIAGLLHESFFIDRIFLPFILGAMATVAKAIASSLLALVFGHGIQAYNFFDRTLWIEAAYNGLISPFVFLLLGLLKKLLITESNRE